MKCPPVLLSNAKLKVPGISLRIDCRTLGVRRLEFSEIGCFVPGDQCDLAIEDGIRFSPFQGRKWQTHEHLT